MKINRTKLDLAMAKACKSISDLRNEFSSATLTKIRNSPGYDINTKTVGRLAQALNVAVEDIIEEVKYHGN